MRIVSGSLKGRRILAPKNLPARPTTDYAKESLFNILQNELHWPSLTMIDLFAGIGSISVEAISRGASKVWAVDAHPKTIKWLGKLASDLSIDDRIVPVRADALHWVSSFSGSADFIFADPPYEFPKYAELIDTICDKSGFNDALFVLEHRKNLSFEEHPNFVQQRTYGEVSFTFFRL